MNNLDESVNMAKTVQRCNVDRANGTYLFAEGHYFLSGTKKCSDRAGCFLQKNISLAGKIMYLMKTIWTKQSKKDGLRLMGVVLLITLMAFSFSCSDDNDDDNGNEQTKDRIEGNLTSGTWRISKFIDSGEDETADFNGYDFTFGGSGVLTADNGNNTYTGTWSITKSSGDDDSSNDLDFNIFFDLTNQFEDLNDDWDFISESATRIELIDVSGGNGGTDYLTFQKN